MTSKEIPRTAYRPLSLSRPPYRGLSAVSRVPNHIPWRFPPDAADKPRHDEIYKQFFSEYQFLKEKAFSLVECTCVLCLILLLYSLALPSFQNILARLEGRLILETLQSAVALAKQRAFAGHTTLTLCSSTDQKHCNDTEDWSQGFILMQGTQLIQVFAGLRYGKLHFEHFGKHLNIQAQGYTHNAGIFTYCPHNGDRRAAQSLVINRAARLYRLSHRNTQGILLKNVGTPQEKALHCR